MTDREKIAREYSQREVSDAESIRQHDFVQRVHEAGQRVGEARVKEIVEEALEHIEGNCRACEPDTDRGLVKHLEDVAAGALAKLKDLGQ